MNEWMKTEKEEEKKKFQKEKIKQNKPNEIRYLECMCKMHQLDAGWACITAYLNPFRFTY